MTDESLFTTQLPTAGDESDGGTGLTRGHVLYATVAGTVKGVRWYPSTTAPPSPPTLELWTPTDATHGTKLASKVYTGSHTPGSWQTQLFDTPVSVAANTYFVPTVCQDTRYVFRASTFVGSITNGHLVGIQDNTDPLAAGFLIGNGRLRFGGPNGYPDFSPGGGPGYLVDVIFAAADAPPPDPDPDPDPATLTITAAAATAAAAGHGANPGVLSITATAAVASMSSGGAADIDITTGTPRQGWTIGHPRDGWTIGHPTR